MNHDATWVLPIKQKGWIGWQAFCVCGWSSKITAIWRVAVLFSFKHRPYNSSISYLGKIRQLYPSTKEPPIMTYFDRKNVQYCEKCGHDNFVR